MHPQEFYRQRIAEQNNVLLGKEDPIMILLTIFEQYEEDLTVLGDEQRQKFLSVLELEQQKWTEESTRRAERLVTRALSVVQVEAENTFTTAGDTLRNRLDETMRLRLADIEMKERTVIYAALVNIVCTCVLALSILLW